MTNPSGTVIDDQSNPVEGATVVAVDSTNGGVLGSATTASDGTYEITVDTDTTAHVFAEWVDGQSTVWRSKSQHSIDVSPEVIVIESFEDGDLSAYTGDTGSFNVSAETFAVDGSNVLVGLGTSENFAQIVSSTLTNTPTRGDNFSVFARTNNAGANRTRIGCAFGYEDGSNYNSLIVRMDSQSDTKLNIVDGGSVPVFFDGEWSESPQADTWYRIDIDYGATASDTIAITTTNTDTATQIQSDSLTSTHNDGADFGWHCNNTDGTNTYADYAHIP